MEPVQPAAPKHAGKAKPSEQELEAVRALLRASAKGSSMEAVRQHRAQAEADGTRVNKPELQEQVRQERATRRATLAAINQSILVSKEHRRASQDQLVDANAKPTHNPDGNGDSVDGKERRRSSITAAIETFVAKTSLASKKCSFSEPYTTAQVGEDARASHPDDAAVTEKTRRRSSISSAIGSVVTRTSSFTGQARKRSKAEFVDPDDKAPKAEPTRGFQSGRVRHAAANGSGNEACSNAADTAGTAVAAVSNQGDSSPKSTAVAAVSSQGDSSPKSTRTEQAQQRARDLRADVVITEAIRTAEADAMHAGGVFLTSDVFLALLAKIERLEGGVKA